MHELQPLNPYYASEISGVSARTRRSLKLVDETRINFDLIEDLLFCLMGYQPWARVPDAPPLRAPPSSGSILVFLPGLNEIMAMSDRLMHHHIRKTQELQIVCMHSSLSVEDQNKVFRDPPKDGFKVVLCTDICQTSITVPSVVAVIDCGRQRFMKYNPDRRIKVFSEDFEDRASAAQRAGDAPRRCTSRHDALQGVQGVCRRASVSDSFRRAPLRRCGRTRFRKWRQRRWTV